MRNELYAKAYAASMQKFAESNFMSKLNNATNKGTKAYLYLKFVLPVLAAVGAGAGAGFVAHKLKRRVDPMVPDGNDIDDLKRVEQLKRIQYYDSVAKQIKGRTSTKGW